MFVGQGHSEQNYCHHDAGPVPSQKLMRRGHMTQERIPRAGDWREMKVSFPQDKKLRELKKSEPLRGIAKAKPVQKRGPQVRPSSKRP